MRPVLVASVAVGWFLAAGIPASAQGMQGDDIDLQAASRVESAGPSTDLKPPRELSVEDAEETLVGREERLWDAYDEWQRTALDTIESEPEQEPEIEETRGREFALPPRPDDPDGEITRQREKEETGR
jgi:hypothetical protein